MSDARGTHRDNIVIGAGEVYLDLIEDGAYSGERYVGDSVSASLSISTERTQVFSGDGPVAAKLVDAVRQVTRTISVTLRDMSEENFALFVLGETAAQAARTAAVIDEEVVVRPGRWYQLGATASSPEGVRRIDADEDVTVTVKDGAEVAQKTGEQENWRVDRSRGRLYIVPGGSIVDGATLQVDYTPADTAFTRVKTGGVGQVRGAFRYIEDAMSGEGRDFYARLCSISGGGELSLKSRDGEQQLTLTVEVQEPEDDWPALSVNGQAS